jgi:iron complex outermembrane recepter protein
MPFQLYSQQFFSISGTVYSNDGSTLPGATVFLHELNLGTTTNSEGFFEILKVKPGNYHVHIYYTGFETAVKTFRIDSKNEYFTFLMKPSSLELKAFVLEESILNIDNNERSLNVEVIDKGFIEKNASTSFAKTLEKIPGINSINMGTGISKPVIRGMSFNRIAVAENGVKQEGQQWGADHGLEIDQYNVERVEIIKGPASLIYGSDAMGGVINIRPPVFPQEGSFISSLTSFGATNNDLLGTSLFAAGNTKGKIFRARLTHQTYGDYKVPAEDFTYNGFVLPLINNRLKNTAGQETSFSSTFGLNRNWGYSTVTVSVFGQHAGLFAGAHGTPRAYQLGDDGDNRDIGYPAQKTQHVKVLSNTNVLLKKNWLTMDIGYQQNHRQEMSLPHAHGIQSPINTGNIEHDLLLQTWSANMRYHHQASERSSRIYGVSGIFQQHRRQGFQFLLPDFISGNAAAFIFQKYKLREKLNVNAGLRYDQTVLDIKSYLEPIYEKPGQTELRAKNPAIVRNFGNFSGGAGLAWIISEKFDLKTNLGSSFRTPTPNELSSNGIHHGAFRFEMGDSSLVPERGYQLDIGLHYHKGDFIVAFTPFFNYFHNYIFLAPSGRFSPLPEAGQVYRFSQTEAILTGGELKADYHLTEALHLGFTSEYVYSMDLKNYYPLPFIPPFSSEVELEYEVEKAGKHLQKSFFNVAVKGFSPQKQTGRNEPATPGYFLINFNAGTNVEISGYKFKVLFSINNLADTHYLNHLSRYRILNLPEPGRNFRISFSFPLYKVGNQ